jgi:hypothetical protein
MLTVYPGRTFGAIPACCSTIFTHLLLLYSGEGYPGRTFGATPPACTPAQSSLIFFLACNAGEGLQDEPLAPTPACCTSTIFPHLLSYQLLLSILPLSFALSVPLAASNSAVGGHQGAGAISDTPVYPSSFSASCRLTGRCRCCNCVCCAYDMFPALCVPQPYACLRHHAMPVPMPVACACACRQCVLCQCLLLPLYLCQCLYRCLCCTLCLPGSIANCHWMPLCPIAGLLRQCARPL